MNTRFRHTVIAAALGSLALTGTLAQTALPPVQQQGAVAYLSGGIGLDESSAIQQASPHWPLTLEFGVKQGQRADFAANVQVVIRDALGRKALETTADGPYLLVRLAPGRYRVDAALAGRTLRTGVQVQKDHPARAVLIWPAGTGDA